MVSDAGSFSDPEPEASDPPSLVVLNDGRTVLIDMKSHKQLLLPGAFEWKIHPGETDSSYLLECLSGPHPKRYVHKALQSSKVQPLGSEVPAPAAAASLPKPSVTIPVAVAGEDPKLKETPKEKGPEDPPREKLTPKEKGPEDPPKEKETLEPESNLKETLDKEKTAEKPKEKTAEKPKEKTAEKPKEKTAEKPKETAPKAKAEATKETPKPKAKKDGGSESPLADDLT